MNIFERFRSGRNFAKHGIPGFLAGAAVCSLLGFGKAEPIQAQAKAPRAATGETLVVAASNNSAGSTQFVIVDTKEKAFAVYEVEPGKKLKLLAARPYEWDLKLEHNNLPPLVREVEQTVKSLPATQR
ncbi:MAG: hypothetical protein NVSMB14_06380 [Isosphaeraceae bacterium]